ncbi:MAG TPA: hypothetical protein VM911_03185 [Pyrinomonadaceae bacterium]|jgi:hypothetical protein|nr:hypothetical protein [Pyrinomonadaceae bacterium]
MLALSSSVFLGNRRADQHGRNEDSSGNKCCVTEACVEPASDSVTACQKDETHHA